VGPLVRGAAEIDEAGDESVATTTPTMTNSVRQRIRRSECRSHHRTSVGASASAPP